MKFEHFALNVETPKQIALWYEKHCGMKILTAMVDAPYTHFLGDETGRVVLELYKQPLADIPNYNSIHHLRFHWAFATKNAEEVKNNLISAGASLVEEIKTPEGSHLVMLRDPFGIPLQICQRATPFNL